MVASLLRKVAEREKERKKEKKRKASGPVGGLEESGSFVSLLLCFLCVRGKGEKKNKNGGKEDKKRSAGGKRCALRLRVTKADERRETKV